MSIAIRHRWELIPLEPGDTIVKQVIIFLEFIIQISVDNSRIALL